MGFTIGNKAHKLFPLADTPGQITKITTTPVSGSRIDAAELTEFDFLAEGESITIDEARAIEVVDFNHESSRGTASHYLRTTRIGVARGAVLQGPLAWRSHDAMEIPQMPKRRVPRFLLTAIALGCLLPLGLPIQEAYLSGALATQTDQAIMEIATEHTWWIMGGVLFMALSMANIALETSLKALEKDPVLKVLTPARRLWA